MNSSSGFEKANGARLLEGLAPANSLARPPLHRTTGGRHTNCLEQSITLHPRAPAILAFPPPALSASFNSPPPRLSARFRWLLLRFTNSSNDIRDSSHSCTASAPLPPLANSSASSNPLSNRRMPDSDFFKRVQSASSLSSMSAAAPGATPTRPSLAPSSSSSRTTLKMTLDAAFPIASGSGSGSGSRGGAASSAPGSPTKRKVYGDR